MFKRDDIITLLRATPFVPFKLHVSNGEVYDIRHPDMMVPSFEWIHLAAAPANNPDGFEKIVLVQMAHVVKLETYSLPQPKPIPNPTAA